MVEPPDFDALYRADPDPFSVRDSWYERRKLAVVLASLARRNYMAAWDPACGTGDLAVALDARCGHVLASDRSPRAVQLTAELSRGHPGVTTRAHVLPRPLPDASARFDLVVASEVVYYLSRRDREHTYELIDTVTTRREPAEVLAVHWRHHPHDAELSGADVTTEMDRAMRARGWLPTVRTDDRDFALAGWSRLADRPQELS